MRRLQRFIRTVLGAALLLAVAPFALTVLYKWVDPPLTVPIAAEYLFGERPRQLQVPLSAVSPALVAGVVMSEDARFCRHDGVDWESLQSQVEAVSEGERARGASTIPMQTVKNLFLWQSRSYLRKAVEIPLALWADLVLGKRRLMEIYLNIAEFGPSIYGAEAAARAWFDKPAAELGRTEAARLASMLPSPKTRNPQKPSRGHARLARTVERRMRDAGPWLDCLEAPARAG
jgi:monofunctional glycosyltransferase